jgi:zinc transport system ATP-binding protein
MDKISSTDALKKGRVNVHSQSEVSDLTFSLLHEHANRFSYIHKVESEKNRGLAVNYAHLPILISVQNVSFSYDDRKLLSQISFSVHKGSFVALLGANGSGKTTLIQLLLGRLKPTLGKISLFGKDIESITDWSFIGYVPQRALFDKNHPATVRELVREPKICSHLGIFDLFEKQFKTLSGGQQQKVLVALALRHNPKLLLLDEPTVGMDEASCQQFYEVLSHLQRVHGITIVLVTHDLTHIKTYATHLLCIDGSTREFAGKQVRCVHD